jgi:putative ABC transport system permease protein
MVPVSYNYRNLMVRWRTTLMTASGFTLVVMALMVMLAFVGGVQLVCARSGQPENVICLREGNFDEILSQMERGMAFRLETMPGVSRGDDGQALCSRELFMPVTQWIDARHDYVQYQVRGVYPIALAVHTQIHITEGRMFRRNYREMIVGRSMARQEGLHVGGKIPVGQIEWDIVGLFEAGGSTFESEAWCDLDQVANHFHREGIYSSVVLRTQSPAAAEALAQELRASKVVSVEAQPEVAYYEQQAEQTETIRIGAIVISFFMSIGAVLGVTNTMFAAIGERIKDIAVMRLLGFRRGEILLSFLLESLFIAIFGGIVGSLLAYCVNGLTVSTALGGKSVAFAFIVDGNTLAIGAAFALAMGILGGLLPAMSAMRVDALETMR